MLQVTHMNSHQPHTLVPSTCRNGICVYMCVQPSKERTSSTTVPKIPQPHMYVTAMHLFPRCMQPESHSTQPIRLMCANSSSCHEKRRPLVPPGALARMLAAQSRQLGVVRCQQAAAAIHSLGSVGVEVGKGVGALGRAGWHAGWHLGLGNSWCILNDGDALAHELVPCDVAVQRLQGWLAQSRRAQGRQQVAKSANVLVEKRMRMLLAPAGVEPRYAGFFETEQ